MSMIGRGVTDRAISRSDGKLIGLLGQGGSAARGRCGCDGVSVAIGGLALGGADQVGEQERVGERPDAARDRRDRRGDLDRRVEVDVADDPAVDDVDPDVDDDRARLEHRAGDEAGSAGGDDDDVGARRRGRRGRASASGRP